MQSSAFGKGSEFSTAKPVTFLRLARLLPAPTAHRVRNRFGIGLSLIQRLRKPLTFLRLASRVTILSPLLIIDWSQVQVLVGPQFTALTHPCVAVTISRPRWPTYTKNLSIKWPFRLLYELTRLNSRSFMLGSFKNRFSAISKAASF